MFAYILCALLTGFRYGFKKTIKPTFDVTHGQKTYILNISYHELEKYSPYDKASLLMVLQMRLDASKLYGGFDIGHEFWFYKQVDRYLTMDGTVDPYIRKGCAEALVLINNHCLSRQLYTCDKIKMVNTYLEDLKDVIQSPVDHMPCSRRISMSSSSSSSSPSPWTWFQVDKFVDLGPQYHTTSLRTLSSNGSVDTDVVNWRDALKGWDDATFKNMDDYEVYNQFSSVV